MEILKSLFRRPAPEVMAARELEIAQRDLMEAQTGREYAEAIINYNRTRIARLRAMLAEANK